MRNLLLATVLLGYDPLGLQSGYQVLSAEPAPRPRRVLMFTAKWCGPCGAAKTETAAAVKQRGWTMGEGPENHVQVVDFDSNPELARRHAIRFVPWLVLLQDGREIARTGYTGPDAAAILLGK